MTEPGDALQHKNLVMLVGPTAVGKSTIMNEVVLRDGDFARATGFTTREPRSNDEPGQYRYVSHESVQNMIKNRQVLQSVANPANGHVYGTSVEDYPGAYNMKDTLSIAVEEFKRIPFKSHTVISITVSPELWVEWLNLRYQIPSAERTKRLQEAKTSVEWSLHQNGDHQWLVNHSGDKHSVAESLIAMVRHPSSDVSAPTEARKMLAMINDLLSYE